MYLEDPLPYLGEIRIFPFGFAPEGWLMCNGQTLKIAEYEQLFHLLGTTYGGDGVTTFALPDLCGRLPVHPGDGIALGQKGGDEYHQLSIDEMPKHTHPVCANIYPAESLKATDNVWASVLDIETFSTMVDTLMAPNAISVTGYSHPHTNMQPYLVLNFCIAAKGILPTPQP